jgi:thiol-disulfide isomerase/thioredoxin
MKRTIPLAAVTALALTATTLAQQPTDDTAEEKPAKTLSIGDKAPAIDIEHWVKGEAVEKFEDGKVYVVEFWATWCGPCKVSMPHLSELQKEYKDYNVTFIGISDEKLSDITAFLEKPRAKGSDETWNDVIGYRLTTDPDKSAYKDYHAASRRPGIPSAFIVGKDQHIEWIGNPHPQSGDNFDKALEEVVKGSWDRNAFKTEWERKEAKAQEDMAAQKAEMRALQPLMAAVQAQDWNKAIELADGMLAKNPKNARAGLTKFMALVRSGETPKAYTFAREFGKTNWDDAMVLNAIAWTIVDDPSIKDRDTELALEFATQANTLTEQKDPAILDTVARCYFESRDLANAVKYQELAVKNAGEDEMGAELKDRLKRYQDELAKQGGR